MLRAWAGCGDETVKAATMQVAHALSWIRRAIYFSRVLLFLTSYSLGTLPALGTRFCHGLGPFKRFGRGAEARVGRELGSSDVRFCAEAVCQHRMFSNLRNTNDNLREGGRRDCFRRARPAAFE
jgi:hypothetical protein